MLPLPSTPLLLQSDRRTALPSRQKESKKKARAAPRQQTHGLLRLGASPVRPSLRRAPHSRLPQRRSSITAESFPPSEHCRCRDPTGRRAEGWALSTAGGSCTHTSHKSKANRPLLLVVVWMDSWSKGVWLVFPFGRWLAASERPLTSASALKPLPRTLWPFTVRPEPGLWSIRRAASSIFSRAVASSSPADHPVDVGKIVSVRTTRGASRSDGSCGCNVLDPVGCTLFGSVGCSCGVRPSKLASLKSSRK